MTWICEVPVLGLRTVTCGRAYPYRQPRSWLSSVPSVARTEPKRGVLERIAESAEDQRLNFAFTSTYISVTTFSTGEIGTQKADPENATLFPGFCTLWSQYPVNPPAKAVQRFPSCPLRVAEGEGWYL